MSEGICVVDSCGQPIWIKKRGLCRSCYRRWYNRLYNRGMKPGRVEVAEPPPPRSCEHCSTEFAVSGGNQRFCSAGCRARALYLERPCDDCGKVRVYSRGSSKPPGPLCRACKTKSFGGSGYVSAHGYVGRVRGPAKEHQCVRCDRHADHWAYDHNDPNEVTGPSGSGRSGSGIRTYSVNPEHYIPMCRSCHQRFDFDRRMEKYGPSDLLSRPVTEWSLDELGAGWAELGMYIRWRRMQSEAVREVA